MSDTPRAIAEDIVVTYGGSVGLMDAIIDAIMSERERCATIADRTAENNRGGTNPASQAAFTVSLETARYIREGVER